MIEKRFLFIALLFLLAAQLLFAQIGQVTLNPLAVTNIAVSSVFERSIYSLDASFSDADTILFIKKQNRLRISRIDSVGLHELSCSFVVDSGFFNFGRYEMIVLSTQGQKKLSLALDIRYARVPAVSEIVIQQLGKTRKDTVQLSGSSKTIASLLLKGSGLFRESSIEFEEAKIKVLSDPSWRMDFAPDSLRLGIEIDGKDIEIGTKRFRIKNNYSMEGFGSIFLTSSRPPMIISDIPSFVADGTEKKVQILGEGFYNGLQVLLHPQAGLVKARFVSSSQADAYLNVPITETSKSYRLVVINPDGRADTSGYFTIRAKPLSLSRIRSVEGGCIFVGKKARVIIGVDTQYDLRLSKRKTYEVSIENEKFPVTQVIDDSTCEAMIKIPDDASQSILNQHTFLINEIDLPPKWKGTLTCKPAPMLTYLSTNRILHPVDTLNLVIKGKNLTNAVLALDDPAVSFRILENRGDLIRAMAIGGVDVSPGTYPLEVRLEGVPFRFDEYSITVQPWQPFCEYVSIDIPRIGSLPPERLWSGNGSAYAIETDAGITVRIHTDKVRPELGDQKVEISGVLMDSSSTIRAEAFDRRMMTLTNGSDVIIWQWRVRERARSGDRIEITLKNPSGQNKVSEQFFIKRHWSEAFHGSTSFILFKIPFGGGNATTEIFRSVGIGMTYQPWYNKKFIAFDLSFLVGNITSSSENLSIDVGAGLSVILWSYLQIGAGANFSGNTSQKGFAFVGTRFKIPSPWR